MAWTDKHLEDRRLALHNAQTIPPTVCGGLTAQEARSDRADAVTGLERQIAEREAEIAGSWLGQHG